jgi:cobalt-zinc-cadmium efflux system protein
MSAHKHPHAVSKNVGPAYGIGIALNLGFVAIEATFGLLAHSSALLADAAHNLGDVLGLVMAWAAAVLARRPSSNRYTYGLGRSTVLAALANAFALVFVVGAVAWSALAGLHSNASANGLIMIWMAAAGVVVNGGSALLFRHHHDLNERGAFLHLAADAAVSAGVVVAGLIVWKTHWMWVDSAASLLVSALVLVGAWRLLRDAMHQALDGVPVGVDLEAVRTFLRALPEVLAVHDLHVWSTSTTTTALTAHLVISWGSKPPAFLQDLEHELHAHFGVAHATVQLEAFGESSACARSENHCSGGLSGGTSRRATPVSYGFRRT